MKLVFSTLALTLGLGLSAAHAQYPQPLPEPGFPIPVRALEMMPARVGNQIRSDMMRVNEDLRRMMSGMPATDMPFLPPAAIPNGFDLPPIDAPVIESTRYSRDTSFSCVNGNFALRHCLNGVKFRVRGTMRDGLMGISEVVVQDGEESVVYNTIDEVPEAHRRVLDSVLKQYQQ